MKKALIVGSNKGYGASISETMKEGGFHIIGLSRGPNNTSVDQHFPITDVSDIPAFTKEFSEVLKKHQDSDTVVFVPGDVVLNKDEELSEEDFAYTLNANLVYVVEAVKQLREEGFVKNIITFGSQWSYLENNQALASYCIAKHLLKHFTELLNQDGINAFHFCVPTSKTDKALSIGTFLKDAHQDLPLEQSEWADPSEITPLIVEKFLSQSKSHLYRFEKTSGVWATKALELVTSELDEKIKKLKLEQFFNNEVLLGLGKKLYKELTHSELAENKKTAI
ncbi:MAG: SDR family oxidoreductase [Patescibacteria group bacterium]